MLGYLLQEVKDKFVFLHYNISQHRVSQSQISVQAPGGFCTCPFISFSAASNTNFLTWPSRPFPGWCVALSVAVVRSHGRSYRSLLVQTFFSLALGHPHMEGAVLSIKNHNVAKVNVCSQPNRRITSMVAGSPQICKVAPVSYFPARSL